MYKPILQDSQNEETFVEQLASLKNARAIEMDELAKKAVKELKKNMVYDNIKVLNKDVDHLMNTMKKLAPTRDNFKISLVPTDDSKLSGMVLIYTQYFRITRNGPAIRENQIWRIGYNEYMKRVRFILMAALSEKTGIPITDTIQETPHIRTFYDKTRWIGIKW